MLCDVGTDQVYLACGATDLRKSIVGLRCFSVQDESFQVYSPRLKPNPLWVSVKEVLSDGAVKVWRRLKNQPEYQSLQIDDAKSDDYLSRLAALEKIKEYRYPVMIIHTDDYEEVTESFIRVNLKGTRLREAELAMAQLAFRWPGALVKEFESALDDYEQANYELDARFMIRCFVAVATGQSRFRHLTSLWQKGEAELENIWYRTKAAIDHTINFLRNNAGIESSDWVPSINALVPIVYYLSKKTGSLTDSEARGLLFWFFEATIHGRFTGSPESKIDQDLRALHSPAPITELIGNLKREIPSFNITPEMIEGKYQRHPFLPLIFVISRQKGAKDWFTGTVLSSTNVGPGHQLELHHIFPKAVLRQKEGFKTEEIYDVANLAFLSQKGNRKVLKSKPEDYLREIEDERLSAQHVPLDQVLWRVDRFKDFLNHRRKLFAQAINKYLQEVGQGYL